jgi:hypothetical protein
MSEDQKDTDSVETESNAVTPAGEATPEGTVPSEAPNAPPEPVPTEPQAPGADVPGEPTAVLVEAEVPAPPPEMPQPSDGGHPPHQGGQPSPVPVKPARARNKTIEAFAELSSSIHALRRDMSGIHHDIQSIRSFVVEVNRKQSVAWASLQSLFKVYNILFSASQPHADDSTEAAPDRTSALAETLMQVIEADLSLLNIGIIKPRPDDPVDYNEMEAIGVEAGALGWLKSSNGVVRVEKCGFKIRAPERPQVLSKAKVIVRK